jgi:hypothetical protein
VRDRVEEAIDDSSADLEHLVTVRSLTTLEAEPNDT